MRVVGGGVGIDCLVRLIGLLGLMLGVGVVGWLRRWGERLVGVLLVVALVGGRGEGGIRRVRLVLWLLLLLRCLLLLLPALLPARRVTLLIPLLLAVMRSLLLVPSISRIAVPLSLLVLLRAVRLVPDRLLLRRPSLGLRVRVGEVRVGRVVVDVPRVDLGLGVAVGIVGFGGVLVVGSGLGGVVVLGVVVVLSRRVVGGLLGVVVARGLPVRRIRRLSYLRTSIIPLLRLLLLLPSAEPVVLRRSLRAKDLRCELGAPEPCVRRNWLVLLHDGADS